MEFGSPKKVLASVDSTCPHFCSRIYLFLLERESCRERGKRARLSIHLLVHSAKDSQLKLGRSEAGSLELLLGRSHGLWFTTFPGIVARRWTGNEAVVTQTSIFLGWWYHRWRLNLLYQGIGLLHFLKRITYWRYYLWIQHICTVT